MLDGGKRDGPASFRSFSRCSFLSRSLFSLASFSAFSFALRASFSAFSFCSFSALRRLCSVRRAAVADAEVEAMGEVVPLLADVGLAGVVGVEGAPDATESVRERVDSFLSRLLYCC
jgi:hypothetical protein